MKGKGTPHYTRAQECLAVLRGFAILPAGMTPHLMQSGANSPCPPLSGLLVRNQGRVLPYSMLCREGRRGAPSCRLRSGESFFRAPVQNGHDDSLHGLPLHGVAFGNHQGYGSEGVPVDQGGRVRTVQYSVNVQEIPGYGCRDTLVAVNEGMSRSRSMNRLSLRA